jgi:hypothetical protein
MAITTVYAIHAPQAERLEAVKADMMRLGRPTLRVIDCGDHYMALEGSHRLAVAHELGIRPEFVVFDQDDEIDITGFDWYDAANWDRAAYLAGEIAGELFAPTSAVAYDFSEAQTPTTSETGDT